MAGWTHNPPGPTAWDPETWTKGSVTITRLKRGLYSVVCLRRFYSAMCLNLKEAKSTGQYWLTLDTDKNN